MSYGKIISIDDKCLQSAYYQDNKKNEITARPELLKLLDIIWSSATIDAIGHQTKVAKIL
ncbi:MAG: hypothetical protein KAH18_04155 [Psychromonas sp.]|nr:hypothetical protein [Psychromonas sp.]